MSARDFFRSGAAIGRGVPGLDPVCSGGCPSAAPAVRRIRAAVLATTMAALGLALAPAGAQVTVEPVRLPQRPESSAGTGGAGPVATHGDPQMRYLLELAEDAARPNRGVPLERLRTRIAQAVLAHPDLSSVEATQRAAQEATLEARAGFLPSVGATLEAAHRRADANPRLGVPEFSYESGNVGINLRQSVYDFGATGATVAASREREAAIAARVDNRRADLALRSVQAWLEVYRSRRLLALAQLNVRSREAMVGFLGQRHELGGGPVSDVWRAQSRLAEAQATLAATQARVQANESAFRELFGTVPGEIDMTALPEFDRAAVAAAAPAVARAFPAVRSAAALQRAIEHERDATHARSLPQVDFELNALRRQTLGAGPSGNEYNAALVLRYDFYTGGASRSRDAQAEWRVIEAEAQARAILLQVERALAQAIADDASSGAVLEARRDGVRRAVDAMRGVREQFAARRGSLLDLLTAQDVIQAAGVALVDAEVEQALGRWRLLYFGNALTRLLGLSSDPVR